MSIEDFSEKEIRKKIINKIDPAIPKSRSKHAKGKIYINNQVVAIVKIPNSHKKIMKQSKSKKIALQLKLNHNDFNDLINCPLKTEGYYKKLKIAVAK